MFNAAVLYAYQPLPAGNRLAIVTNAGGPGVMATDAAIRCGLSVPRLAAETMEKMRGALPATANLKNPVDVIGDARADRYTAALEAVLDDPNIDQTLVILTPQSMTDIEAIARGICKFHETADQADRLLVHGRGRRGAGHPAPAAGPHPALHPARVGLRGDGLRADASASGASSRWPSSSRCRSIGRPPGRSSTGAERGYLDEDQALAVLEAYGMPVPQYKLCTTADEAAAFAEHDRLSGGAARGQPADHPQVGGAGHRLEPGRRRRRSASAFERMQRHLAAAVPEAEIRGMLVRRMIPAGLRVDPRARSATRPSGRRLMFGLGGIYVELFSDVTFGLAPIDVATAGRMIRQVKAFRLLQGARGKPPADVKSIEECLVRLGQLVADFDRIAELDINPLIAGPAHERQCCGRRAHPAGRITTIAIDDLLNSLENPMDRREVEKRVVKVVCHVLGVRARDGHARKPFRLRPRGREHAIGRVGGRLRARVPHRNGRRRRPGGADGRRGRRVHRQVPAIAAAWPPRPCDPRGAAESAAP